MLFIFTLVTQIKRSHHLKKIKVQTNEFEDSQTEAVMCSKIKNILAKVVI